MDRRKFLMNTSLGGLALGLPVIPVWSQQDGYSLEELTGKADLELYGEGINLRKEAHDAFMEMKKEAYEDGIDIKVVSSFRGYERQRAIFERKFIAFTEEGMDPLEAIDKIVEYSTIPGTSLESAQWYFAVATYDGERRNPVRQFDRHAIETCCTAIRINKHLHHRHRKNECDRCAQRRFA